MTTTTRSILDQIRVASLSRIGMRYESLYKLLLDAVLYPLQKELEQLEQGELFQKHLFTRRPVNAA